MNTTSPLHIRAARRATALAAVAVVLAVGPAPAASAKPDPGPKAEPAAVVADSPHAPLRRIGTQFIRGQYLTGAGVPAPLWIREWTPPSPQH